jgi:hypothetical protein
VRHARLPERYRLPADPPRVPMVRPNDFATQVRIQPEPELRLVFDEYRVDHRARPITWFLSPFVGRLAFNNRHSPFSPPWPVARQRPVRMYYCPETHRSTSCHASAPSPDRYASSASPSYAHDMESDKQKGRSAYSLERCELPKGYRS